MKNQPNIASFVILQKEDWSFLLANRKNTWFMDGYYNFPSWHLEKWEDVLTTAIREAKEEIWVEILPENLKLVHVLQRESADKTYIYFYRLTKTWQNEPQILEQEKCDHIGRFSYQDLDNIKITPWDKQALCEIQKWNIYSSIFG